MPLLKDIILGKYSMMLQGSRIKPGLRIFSEHRGEKKPPVEEGFFIGA
jgi:hypothetical protein